MKKIIILLSIFLVSCAPMMDVKIDKTQKIIETDLKMKFLSNPINGW
jgi:hypothetical protein